MLCPKQGRCFCPFGSIGLYTIKDSPQMRKIIERECGGVPDKTVCKPCKKEDWGALVDHASRNMTPVARMDDESESGDGDAAVIMHQRLHKFLSDNTSESEAIARLKRNLEGANAAHKQEKRKVEAAGKQAVAVEQQKQQLLRQELAAETSERQRLTEREEEERARLHAEMEKLRDELRQVHAERKKQAEKHEEFKRRLDQRFGAQQDVERQDDVSSMQTKLLEQRARQAEERVRNEERELKLLRQRVAEKEEQMSAVIGDFKRKQAETSQVERAKREELIKQLVLDADKEKEALQQELRAKEDEVTKTKRDAAEEKDDQRSLLQGMADMMQQLKDADSYVDKMLRGKFLHRVEEELKRNPNYYMKKPGSLDTDKLKKLGLKLHGIIYRFDEETDEPVIIELDLWVATWQSSVVGAEHEDDGRLPSSYPRFNPKEAFRFAEGRYVAVREEDEIIPGMQVRMGERIIKAPDTHRSAAFVKEIRRRYKSKADGILRHLMEACNLYLDCSEASGYSVPHILWDREQDARVTPADKLKLLLGFLGA